MYKRSEYQVEDYEILFDFMNRYSFATLLSSGQTRFEATHLPFIVSREPKPFGTLISHMAKENPQWEAFQNEKEVLVIFQGPYAYISPSWYLVSRTVPTWNYTVVHAYGVPRLIVDEEQVWLALTNLVKKHENESGSGWDLSRLPGNYLENLVKKIVMFEIRISRLDGKFKLSQDKPEEDRANVVRKLAGNPDPCVRMLASLMEKI